MGVWNSPGLNGNRCDGGESCQPGRVAQIVERHYNNTLG